MISLIEATQFKNQETEQFLTNLLNPKTPAKIAYQKFKNGKAVLTVITRD